MVSRVARHTTEILGVIIALGAMPRAGFPQSESDGARVNEKERIAAEILAAQAKDGPRSPGLIQLLTDLGVLYETEGEHALATAALEQARQLVRANYGLFTLDQVPLMQQALANQHALGNAVAVRAIEEEFLDLAARHPADLRSAAIHHDAGLRRLDVLRRFLAGEAPSEVYPEGGLPSFWKEDVISDLVSDAQVHFADAAAVILRNGLHSSDELRALEMEIVRASNIVRRRLRSRMQARSIAAQEAAMLGNRFSTTSTNHRDRVSYNPALAERMNTLSNLASRARLQGAPAALQDAVQVPRGGDFTTPYQVARDSYYRLIAYDEAAFGDSADETSLRNRLEAYMQMADWDLLYAQNGLAFDQYARVLELLKTTGNGDSLIAELFASRIPIVLPTFQPNPLETEVSARYIDVTFEVSQYGESRRVEIVSATPDVSGAEKDDLVSLIKGARFRPRVVDGELGRPSPLVLRYYLGEAQP